MNIQNVIEELHVGINERVINQIMDGNEKNIIETIFNERGIKWPLKN